MELLIRMLTLMVLIAAAFVLAETLARVLGVE